MPCLNSSPECIELLTEKAIAHSPELQTLDEQITLLEQRLELGDDRIRYTRRKHWTNYITTDPIRLVQNLLGGGDIQRDNIEIAKLEIRRGDLQAAQAALKRRHSEVKARLRAEVWQLLLDYEAAQRHHALLSAQLTHQQFQQQLIEIDYRYGQGSTSQILALREQRQRLENQLLQSENQQILAIQKLRQLTTETGIAEREEEKIDPGEIQYRVPPSWRDSYFPVVSPGGEPSKSD